MTVAERLTAIKHLMFNTTPPAQAPAAAAAPTPAPVVPTAAASSVVSYAVDGGVPVFTDISNDGVPGLDMSDYVFTDEALTMPYPDGTYNVTGTSFSFTVAGGVITNITDAAGTGPGEAMVPAVAAAAPAPAAPATQMQMSEMTPEKINALFAVTGQSTDERVASLETMVKALMQSCMGYEIAKATQSEAIEAYRKTIEGYDVEMQKQQKFATQAIELMEELIKQPSADPVTLPESKKEGFMSAKEKKLAKFAESIDKMNAEKKLK